MNFLLYAIVALILGVVVMAGAVLGCYSVIASIMDSWRDDDDY